VVAAVTEISYTGSLSLCVYCNLYWLGAGTTKIISENKLKFYNNLSLIFVIYTLFYYVNSFKYGLELNLEKVKK